MEALKEIVEQNWLNPQPESDSVKTFLATSDQDLKAIRDDKLLVMMARLDRHRAESLMDGYVGPVTLELVEFYSIYTEHPSSLMELNNAARYLAFESNDPYRIRRACVHWLVKYEPDFLMDWWSVQKMAPPNTRLPGQGPMTQKEFEHFFGPREIISIGESVTCPMLSESLTTWGWWLPGEHETDWGARAEALSIATEMARHAREGRLLCRLRNSQVQTPYFPFAARWNGSLGLEGFRAVLGLNNDNSGATLKEEEPFVALLRDEFVSARGYEPTRDQAIAFELFFGIDAVNDGPWKSLNADEVTTVLKITRTMARELSQCRQFYIHSPLSQAVFPIFLVGRTEAGYLAGLCSYTVDSQATDV